MQNASPTPPMLPESKVGHIEGIRGIAALVVVINHFMCAVSPSTPIGIYPPFKPAYHYPDIELALPNTPFSLLWNGAFSVAVFYLLSGRVLALSYLKTKNVEKLVSALIRRSIRLGLPLLGAHFILWTCLKLNAFNHVEKLQVITGSSWLKAPINDLNGFGHFLLRSFEWLAMPVTSESDINRIMNYPAGVIWTIPFELWSSLSVYLAALAACNLNKNKYLFYAMLIVWNWWTVSLSTIFFTGLLFSDLSFSGQFTRFDTLSQFIKLPFKALLVVLFYLPLMGTVNNHLQWAFLPFLFNGHSVGFDQPLPFYKLRSEFFIPASAFVLLVEISPTLQKLFTSHKLDWLGKVSFGLYIMHGLVLHIVFAPIVVHLLNNAGWQYWSACLAGLLTYIPCCLGCAWLFWRVFDEPSNRFARWSAASLFALNEKQGMDSKNLEEQESVKVVKLE